MCGTESKEHCVNSDAGRIRNMRFWIRFLSSVRLLFQSRDPHYSFNSNSSFIKTCMLDDQHNLRPIVS